MTTDPLHNTGLRSILRTQLRELDKEVDTAADHVSDCIQQLAEAEKNLASATHTLADYVDKQKALEKVLENSNITQYAVILGTNRNDDRVQVVEAAAFDSKDRAEAWATAMMGKTVEQVRDQHVRTSWPSEVLIESDCDVTNDVVAGWTIEAFTIDDGTVDSWTNPVTP